MTDKSIFRLFTKSCSIILIINIFTYPCSFTLGQTPANKLVKVKEIIPDIEIELKYATAENFTKQILYPTNTCFLAFGALENLKLVQDSLRNLQFHNGMNYAGGLGLKIWDGYRPRSVQYRMWNIVPDPLYVDETYIGGQWKNKRQSAKAGGSKRGRGTSKTPVFGILCWGGKVWAQVVPDVEAKTLMPLISRRVEVGSTIWSDTWPSYTGVAAKGYVHRLVKHHKGEYSDGKGNHINGLEGFWGYLKRRLAAKGGIRKERLPLYLAEYVWRYNHRNDSIQIQKKLIMKQLERLLI